MKFLKCFLLIFAFAFLLSTFSADAANVRLSKDKLNKLGINTIRFALVHVSKNNVVLGYEKVSDAEIKIKGTAYKLWIFDFSGKNASSAKISSVMLPCTDLQNAAISHDGKMAIISAERGSKFIKVDIPNKTASVIFEHKKGQRGFRCSKGIVQTFSDGKICADGYLYDQNDKFLKEAFVFIDPSKTGENVFSLAYDTTSFEKKIGNKVKFVAWVAPDKCFWCGKVGSAKKEESLHFFNNGKSTQLAVAPMFLNLAVGFDRVIFTTADKPVPGSTGDNPQFVNPATYIIDIASDNAKKKLGVEGKLYMYLSMSADGSTAIMSDQNVKAKQVTYYCGKKSNGFAMKEVNGQKKVPISQLRLSPDGKSYVTWDGYSLVWGEL